MLQEDEDRSELSGCTALRGSEPAPQKGSTEKLLTIDIQPGWKVKTAVRARTGTAQRPPRAPGEHQDHIPQGGRRKRCVRRALRSCLTRAPTAAADLTFVLQEKPHPRFRREGNNLVHMSSISLRQVRVVTARPRR